MIDRHPTADHWYEKGPKPPSIWGSVILLAGLVGVFALSNRIFRSSGGNDPRPNPPEVVNPSVAVANSSDKKEEKVDNTKESSLREAPRLELIAVLNSSEKQERLSPNEKGGIDLPFLPIAGSKARFSFELREQVEGQRHAQFRLCEKTADGNAPLTNRPSNIFVEVEVHGPSSDHEPTKSEFPLLFKSAAWEQWVVGPETSDPLPNTFFAPTLQMKPEFWKLLDIEVTTVPLVVRWEHRRKNKKESGLKGQYEIQLTRPGANALVEKPDERAPLLSSEFNCLRFDFDLGGYESAVAYKLTADFPGPDAINVKHDWKPLDSAPREPPALEWSLKMISDETFEIAWHLPQRSDTP